MNPKEMSNHELLVYAKTLATNERELVVEMIRALREIDRRKLFIGLGYSSLFEYCTERLGLSEDQSYKRIRVTRLAAFHPQVIEKLARGEVKLSHLAVAAGKLTKANANLVFEAMKGASKREFEAKLRRIQEDGTVLDEAEVPKTRLVLECDEATLAALERVKGLLLVKGRLKSAGVSDVVEAMAEYCLDKLDPTRIARRAQSLEEKRVKAGAGAEAAMGSAPAAVGLKELDGGASELIEGKLAPGQVGRSRGESGSRYIPAAERHRAVLRGGERCAFVSPEGRRCQATVGLEFDHYPLMVCEGGANKASGLQRLCRAHNQYRAERRLGHGFMEAKRRRAGDPMPSVY